MCAASLKSFIFVEFPPGETVTGWYLSGGASSVASALQQMKGNIPGRRIATKLIVLPKRHRHGPDLTHTKADRANSDKTYIAVMERDKFVAACEKADHQWQKDIDKVKKRIERYKKPNRKVSIDDVPAPLLARIKIDSSGCWLWKMAKSGRVRKKEYGIIKYKGNRWQAHRLLYVLLIGKIPKDAFLMHSCDTPACVNPDHLMPASPRKNFGDMVSKGRSVWQKRKSKKLSIQ